MSDQITAFCTIHIIDYMYSTRSLWFVGQVPPLALIIPDFSPLRKISRLIGRTRRAWVGEGGGGGWQGEGVTEHASYLGGDVVTERVVPWW